MEKVWLTDFELRETELPQEVVATVEFSRTCEAVHLVPTHRTAGGVDTAIRIFPVNLQFQEDAVTNAESRSEAVSDLEIVTGRGFDILGDLAMRCLIIVIDVLLKRDALGVHLDFEVGKSLGDSHLDVTAWRMRHKRYERWMLEVQRDVERRSWPRVNCKVKVRVSRNERSELKVEVRPQEKVVITAVDERAQR